MKRILSIFLVLFFSLNNLSVFASSLEDQYDVLESKKYDMILNFTYPENGEGYAFKGIKNGKQILIKNGVEIKGYDFNAYPNLTFSENGKNFAFVGIKDGKNVLVKDGIEINNYESYSNLTYSPDGKSFSFVAGHKDGRQSFIKDNKELFTFPYNKLFIPIKNIIYSPDGKSYSIIIIENINKSYIIKDGNKIDSYDSTYNPTYSPDGKGFSFIAQKDGKSFIVKDGEELEDSKNYDQIQDLIYSPNGKELSFIAKRGDKIYLFRNGVESDGYYLIFNTITDGYKTLYSEDGKSLSFVANDDGYDFVMKDGKLSSDLFEGISYLGYLQNSRDIYFVGYSQGEGKSYIIKNSEKIFETNSGISYLKFYNDKDYTFLSERNLSFNDDGTYRDDVEYNDNLEYNDFNNVYFIVKNGILKSKEYIYIYGLHYLPEGKGFNFLANTKDGKQFFVQYKLKENQKTIPDLTTNKSSIITPYIKGKVKLMAYKYKKDITKKEFLIKELPNEIKKYPEGSLKGEILKELLNQLIN